MATHKDPNTQAMIDHLAANEALVAQLRDAFNTTVEETGDASYARFTQAITAIMSDEVKPLTKALRASYPIKRGGGGGTDNAWRAELKDHFSGRGRQWVKVALDDIAATLDDLEIEGHDVENYRKWVNNAGYAWVRFSGGRLNDDAPAAAFEVRYGGSKIDHPGVYHYMTLDAALEAEFLPNTPYGLRLED